MTGRSDPAARSASATIGDWDARFLADVRRDMLSFAGMQLRDDALAEDVVQETMVAALGGQQSFAGRSALKTWVFAILRNKIVDAIRHRRRSINISSLAEEGESSEAAFDAMFKENGRWTPEARPPDWGIRKRHCIKNSFGQCSRPVWGI